MRWLCVLTFIPFVWALRESEAGIVDWHQVHVGVPLTETPAAAPSFHAKHGSSPTDALLLAATSSNVLAALHVVNGSIGAWFISQVVLLLTET